MVGNTISRGSRPGANHATYSPDGRFIAVDLVDSVELCDPTTLERLEVLDTTYGANFGSLSFSPDGRLLAYAYSR